MSVEVNRAPFLQPTIRLPLGPVPSFFIAARV